MRHGTCPQSIQSLVWETDTWRVSEVSAVMRWDGAQRMSPHPAWACSPPTPAAGVLPPPGSLLALPGWVGSLFCAPAVPSLPASHTDHTVKGEDSLIHH